LKKGPQVSWEETFTNSSLIPLKDSIIENNVIGLNELFEVGIFSIDITRPEKITSDISTDSVIFGVGPHERP